MSARKLRTAISHLKVELRKLKRVHGASILSYQHTYKVLQNQLKAKEIDAQSQIIVKIGGEDYVIEGSPHAMIRRLETTYPEILREALFVKAISQFEVFLVDTVLEIANRSKKPFMRQEKIIYPQAQLLSFSSIEEIYLDIIKKERRQITSGGFDYARRYFESKLDIRFADAKVNISQIREMHERRHIFVHRGGRVDEKYIGSFAKELNVGDRLHISEEYFHLAVDSLLVLAEHITSVALSQWPSVNENSAPRKETTDAWKNSEIYKNIKWELPNKKRPLLGYWFRATFHNKDDVDAHLNARFSFTSNDQQHFLSEILIGSEVIQDCEIEWVVGGERQLIGDYVAYQKKLARNGCFLEFNSKQLKK